MTEELTTYEGGGGELEFEIESLRTLLHEAPELQISRLGNSSNQAIGS